MIRIAKLAPHGAVAAVCCALLAVATSAAQAQVTPDPVLSPDAVRPDPVLSPDQTTPAPVLMPTPGD